MNNVYFSRQFGCWVWECFGGHMGLDFEGETEALEGFSKHRCPFN